MYFDTRSRNREKACERAAERANFRPNAADPKIFFAALRAAINWAAAGNLIKWY